MRDSLVTDRELLDLKEREMKALEDVMEERKKERKGQVQGLVDEIVEMKKESEEVVAELEARLEEEKARHEEAVALVVGSIKAEVERRTIEAVQREAELVTYQQRHATYRSQEKRHLTRLAQSTDELRKSVCTRSAVAAELHPDVQPKQPCAASYVPQQKDSRRVTPTQRMAELGILAAIDKQVAKGMSNQS